MLDSVKAHVGRHQKAYTIGTYVVVAGVTVVVTRGMILRQVVTVDGVRVAIRPVALFAKQTVITIIQLDRSGPLSWVIRCVETGEEFMSQHAAAVAKGISETNLSKHLNGFQEHAGGLHFERIGLAG